MIGIGEASKQFDISENMLRDWEKKGLLGEVAQIDGKRMYSEDQLERIRFINREILEQRKKGWKRTNYRQIEDAMLDQFGGEIIVREAQTPEQAVSLFMKQVESRDFQLQNALQSIFTQLQELVVDKSAPVLPDTSKQDELLQSIYASLQKNKEKEDDLEGKYEVLKRENEVQSANLKKLADVHQNLIEKLDKTQEENKKLREEKRDLQSELEQWKNKPFWKTKP